MVTRRPTTTAAALAVLVLGLTGCSAGTEKQSASLPPVEVETGVLHVHGLGVDPADGALYAATHSGLFRLPEQGRAERIANRAQDTMGFAVVGPGRFIGSGHPDFREDDVRPPLLGLIESDDAGLTWQRLSLHGEADFHALASAHGLVYGYDSTSSTFMVSEDKKRWDQRSRLELLGFAVDPVDADRIVAATPQGLAASADGGRNWQPLSGAPPLVAVAWPAGGGLYGAAVDGSLHRSADGGRTWTRGGSFGGEPEALAVDSRGGATAVYVAVGGKGVLMSGDRGRTFKVRYAEDAP